MNKSYFQLKRDLVWWTSLSLFDTWKTSLGISKMLALAQAEAMLLMRNCRSDFWAA